MREIREIQFPKGVLRNFVKFTGKHLCQSLFFNKVAGLRPAALLKKRLWHRYFLVNSEKFLRTSFFIERLWWWLLQLQHKSYDWILYYSEQVILNAKIMMKNHIQRQFHKMVKHTQTICGQAFPSQYRTKRKN